MSIGNLIDRKLTFNSEYPELVNFIEEFNSDDITDGISVAQNIMYCTYENLLSYIIIFKLFKEDEDLFNDLISYIEDIEYELKIDKDYNILSCVFYIEEYEIINNIINIDDYNTFIKSNPDIFPINIKVEFKVR